MIENKLSAVLVVKDEERVIERCLESLRDAVDEVILVHDGVCKDATLKIAKRVIKPSKLKIYERCAWNNAEPHRQFGLLKARFRWIMYIDSDEVLSDKLIKDLRKILDRADYEGYNQVNVKWSHKNWNMDDKLSVYNFKCFLHKRDFSYHTGIPHHPYWTGGRVLNLDDYILEHWSMPDGWNREYLDRKIFRRALAEGRYRVWIKNARLNRWFYLAYGTSFAFAEALYFLFARRLIFHPKSWSGIPLGMFYWILVYWYVFRIKSGKLSLGDHKPGTCRLEYCSYG